MPNQKLIDDFEKEPSGCIALRLGEAYLTESNLAESIKWFTRGLLFNEYSAVCADLLQVICTCHGKNRNAEELSTRFMKMAGEIRYKSIYPEKSKVRSLSMLCCKALNQEVVVDPFLQDSDPQPKSTAPAFRI